MKTRKLFLILHPWYIMTLLTLVTLLSSCASNNYKLRREAASGNASGVRAYLNAGADVNAKDSRGGMTALMFAVYSGDHQTIRVLLDAGADVNAKDSGGMTALTFAIYLGKPKTVQVLLDAGADVHAIDLKIAEEKRNTEIIRLLGEPGAK
jgi:ankyrin repeat protein